MQNSSLKRKTSRCPFQSLAPANCAPKIDAPEMPPKIVMLKTKTSWFAMATLLIGVVPSAPTIRLSARLAKFVSPC